MFLIRSHNGFIATTSEELDELKKYTLGERYKVKITKPRNIKFHRKFFAFIKLCYYHKPESMESISSQERMREYISFGVGFYDTWITPGGKEIYKPRSISFASMDDVAFQDFYDRAVNFACKHILKGLTEEEISKELINFI